MEEEQVNSKQEIGALGEEYAAEFLKKLGCEIIERNYRSNMGEIDLIVKDHDELVFVEVKTRGQLLYGTPGEAVNKQKKNHIYHVAEYYLMKNHLEHVFCRIDVVEVYLSSKSYSINHLKNCVLDRPIRKRRSEGEEEEAYEWIDTDH